MRNRLPFLLCLLLIALPAAAQNTFEGVLPEDAGLYRIDLPAGWQPGGRLIIYNHGLTMQQPAQSGAPSTAPSAEVREFWLAQGYALAAGSYSTRGWAVFDLEHVQRELLGEFTRRAGTPGEILLVGGSLGGLVSLRTAESYAADGVAVAGVYSLCPPVGGSRSWDTALDARLIFDAVCETPLPSGSEPLPWVVDYADIPSSIEDIDNPQALLNVLPVANVIRKCTGLFQPAFLDTTAQLARRALLERLLGIDSDDFLQVLLGYAIYPLADLVQAPEKLSGHNAFDNRFVDYGDAAVNASILRVEHDPIAAVRLRAQSDIRGDVGAAKVLAIHSSRDELVVPEHLSVLQERLPAAQLATAIVAEDTPAHCEFSPAEFVTGFLALRRWIDEGDKPDAAGLKQACDALPPALGGGSRCGFDPSLQPGDLDERIRPRNLERHQVTRHETGSWFDPETAGEGAIIEVLEGGELATVAWYSYPAEGEPGEQTWIIGLGRVTEDGIHVAEARQYGDGGFGSAFDPAALDDEIWGEMTFAFAGCGEGETRHPGSQGTGRLRFRGPPEYGSGERQLYQLTNNAVFPEHCVQFVAPQVPQPQSRWSGSWFRGPQAPGEGLQLQVDSSGLIVAIWYTYDLAGNPAWLIGTAPLPADGEPWVIPMNRPRGTRFGESFDRSEVQELPWGEIRVDFASCDSAELTWDASEAGWPDGSLALQRLTRPEGIPDCGSGS